MPHSREFVQKLQLQIKIPAHTGCVNSICWNENGRFLLSGSDDQRLSVVHGHNYSVLAVIPTGHRANIFSAKFLPNTDDTKVVSCSGDGIIIFSHLGRAETSLNNKFNCHRGTAYEIITVPNDPNTFLSCGEDRTVRWFDVRTKQCCLKDNCKDDVLINCRSPVTSLAVNPLSPYQLAVGCGDASVRIYDRRMLSTQTAGTNNSFRALMTCFTVPEFTQTRRITSLCYSSDGQEMLVSYSSDYIYLFDVRDNLDKKPKMLSRNSSDGSDSDSGVLLGRPLVKRLRVRGDWSDTGPNARPEAESRGDSTQQDSSHEFSLVRRMTDILTRMFYDSSRNRSSRSEVSQSSSESSQAFSRSESDEGTNDNEHGEWGSTHGATDVQANSQAAQESEPVCEAGSSSGASRKKGKEDSKEQRGAKCSSFESDSNVPDKEQERDSLKSKNRTEKIAQAKVEAQPNTENKGKRRLNVRDKVFTKLDSENKRKREQDIANDKTCDDNNVVCDTLATTNDSLSKHAVANSSESEPSTSKNVPDPSYGVNENYIPSQQEEDISESVNLDFKNIEEKLESRRKDLIEKHHAEPMMNFHYSGEGVSSGIITMDVASSSTPNERQWLEQSASDLPDLPSDLSLPTSVPSQPSENVEPTRDPQSSSESETDVVLDSVQPNSDFNRIVRVPSGDLVNSAFEPTPRVRTTVENPGRDIEFRMEVDSWDTDSEDDTRSRAARRTRFERRPSFDSRLPFLSSLEDEIQTKSEDGNKEELQFDNVTQPRVKRKYTGHRNARTMIKESTFWGDNFIMSGSDCGHIFVWDRETTELVMLMEADHHVVNCLQPHPFDPILASSGIDYDIKIWAPLKEEPFFDREKAVEIIQRNEVMLEETKDTITVPASFMFRMLVSLSDYRASRIRTRESIQRLRQFVSGDESRT
ncbi:DDB1- and CUL4-associated factor 6-like isoform X2 [Uloborus diversus]|uniref:DDB1- and CUL4-associated factor 6-like isoform X2 n=1 Tax=Uloborus diversus TaxID=327109 RepID=UPI00240975E6|nr:DDB1- and CUL4-associated factor 6-like isoform X2 [Uloborus diversus]